MIIAVSMVRVLPDKIVAFEAAFRDFVAEIRANEPGTLFYDMGLSRDEPNTYRVIEAYVDEAAKAFHLRTAYFAASMAAISPYLVGPPQFVLHDAIS